MNTFAAVITMNTGTNRFKAFSRNNKHLEFQVFQGISGAHISKEARVASGLVTAELAATVEDTDFRLGCAVSHWSLWQEAVRTNSGALIMEDDAMTHPDIWSQAELLAQRDEVDIALFGCNMNTTLSMQAPEGFKFAGIFDPMSPSPDWITKTLARTHLKDVRYWKLSRAFGTCCYFVTPRGAKLLSDRLFPLRMDGTYVPFLENLVMGCTIDNRLNALYDDLNAVISMPFLAYTPHHNEFAPV
jgi:GR25 family glycosyltransferase involved in LPS biosynthesis